MGRSGAGGVRGTASSAQARRAAGRAGAAALAALLTAAASGPAVAQSGTVLPNTGELVLAGACALTLDGTAYTRCECRLMVSVSAGTGQYLLSGLNVGCDGRAGEAAGLSGLVGVPGRTVQVLYDHGPTTASGSGMWLTTSTATVGNVLADESWLLLTLRLDGPTRFENSFGKACVDGSTGARC